MICQIMPDHRLWADLVAHLERHDMARWALTESREPLLDHLYLGAVTNAPKQDDQDAQHQHVIGNIVLRVQPIVMPETEWSTGHNHTLIGPDGVPLCETFVATFAVDDAYRRRGYGRALQCAALDLTHTLGYYQMRSWSSLDKTANYALKLGLGFAAQPAILTLPAGQQISGVYFSKVATG